jgi:hypothetical protein
MTAPNQVLMEAYGTEEVYREKLANKKPPLSAALALPLLGYGALRLVQGQADDDQTRAVQDNEAVRAADAARNAGDVAALRGSSSPGPSVSDLFLRRALAERSPETFDDYPLELFKEGAEVAEHLGRVLAKEAGIGVALGAMGRGVANMFSKAPAAVGRGMSALGRAPQALASGAQSAAKPVLSRMPGLGGGGWKSKALVGGLALGGGYAALQGGKALYNAGMAPAKVKVQGAGPALPRYVNQYGVPTS